MNLVDIIIFGTATLTAAISSTLGMAGGLVLLSVMTLFMDLREAIPLHGFAQLCSNIGRVSNFRKNIHWGITLRFSLLVLPGAYLGIRAAGLTNKFILEIIVSLVMLWIVHSKPKTNSFRHHHNFFIILGFLSSFIGVIAGATGPLIVPFFMGIGLEKKEMVATKASCQSIVQFIKLPAFFFFAHVQLLSYTKFFTLFIIAAIIGSWLGKKIIDRLSEDKYEFMIRWSVTLLALNQIIRAGLHFA